MRATLWSLTFTRPEGFQIKFAQRNRKDTFAICQLYGLGWKITSSVFSGLCALLVNSLPAKVDRNVLRVLSWGEITGLHQNNQGEWLLPELECNHNAEVKISFKCIPMEDCGRESSNKNIKIPAEVDRYVWKHTGNRYVNEEVSTFLLQYIFSHFAESKNLGRYRRILLLLIGWVLVFPCSLEMVFFFFGLQNFKSCWKSYSECCNFLAFKFWCTLLVLVVLFHSSLCSIQYPPLSALNWEPLSSFACVF